MTREILQGYKINFLIAVLVLLVLGTGGFFISPALADGPPERSYTLVTPYTEYEWWLISWSDNQPRCKIHIDHPNQPSPAEIYYQCGEEELMTWLDSPACAESDQEAKEKCTGYYLHLANTYPREKEVVLHLPPAEAWISIENCQPEEISSFCKEIPSLLITGHEPLPEEKIIEIQGKLNGVPFYCEGKSCRVPLHPTGEQGVPVEFWANSSYGDSSQHYQGRVRVLPSMKKNSALPDGWQFHLISDRWADSEIQGCAQSWQAFPPPGAPPAWLSDPTHPAGLATQEQLAYLAGKLILHRLADAGGCPDGGLLPNGYASACGLDAARLEVIHWQNSFDSLILKASQESAIPSTLLKRIFAQESQFWPETIDYHYTEYGFGQLTDLGAEVTLLWNKDFFAQFCPLVLSRNACQLGYVNLDPDYQALLRGALLEQVRVEHQDLSAEIDHQQMERTIHLFSQTLVGNCQQVRKMIENSTEQMPGQVSSYQDLWRFTLVNYHAGAGCLAEAIDSVSQEDRALNWENISQELEEYCPAAVEYVETISR